MKKWIKLLRVYDGKPVGEIFEVDEAVARALCAGGVAEDATDKAEGVLAATQTAELRSQMDGLVKEIGEQFRLGTEQLKAARPDLGRIDFTESEDDSRWPKGTSLILEGDWEIWGIKRRERALRGRPETDRNPKGSRLAQSTIYRTLAR